MNSVLAYLQIKNYNSSNVDTVVLFLEIILLRIMVLAR